MVRFRGFRKRRNENEQRWHPTGIEEGVSGMRVSTAYLMDGRGQSADGRRKATPLPIVLDDAHDAVDYFSLDLSDEIANRPGLQALHRKLAEKNPDWCGPGGK